MTVQASPTQEELIVRGGISPDPILSTHRDFISMKLERTAEGEFKAGANTKLRGGNESHGCSATSADVRFSGGSQRCNILGVPKVT